MSYDYIGQFNTGYAPWLQAQMPACPTFGALGWGGNWMDFSSSLWQLPNLYPNIQGKSPALDYDIQAQTAEEYNKKQAELLEATFKARSGLDVVLTQNDVNDLREAKKDVIAKQNDAAKGTMVGTLAGTAVFTAGKIANGAQVKTNKPVTDMFFEYDDLTSKAKYQQLFDDSPKVMEEAMEEMQKMNRKMKKAMKKGLKSGKTAELRKNYLELQKIMQEALDKNDAKAIAEATERLRAANGGFFHWFKKKPSVKAAKAADVSKVKVSSGKNFFKNLKGSGLGMGVVAAGVTLYSEKDLIEEAYKHGEDVGRKQLLQTGAKALVSTATYSLAEAGTKTVLRKSMGKIATKTAGKVAGKAVTKIATKVVGKCAGKAIGAAIGSIVPGAGTVIGLLIGAAIDFAISKWVMPKILGAIDAKDEADINKASSEELVTSLYIDKKNGVELSPQAEAIIARNPNFCAKVDKELAAVAANA